MKHGTRADSPACEDVRLSLDSDRASEGHCRQCEHTLVDHPVERHAPQGIDSG